MATITSRFGTEWLDYGPSTGHRKATGFRLATLASDEEISYTSLQLSARDDAGRVWHAVNAKYIATGETWTYLLAADWGSYRGRFPGLNS